MRKMGKSKIGYRNDKVPGYYSWNPGGCGCSGGCDGCWARAMSGRMGPHCDKCKAFEVHLHEERLCLPAQTKTPGVVLVNFTCDTFDKERPDVDVVKILRALDDAPHHNYVFLTKNPEGMACWDFRSLNQQGPHRPEHCKFPPNLWLGLSLCNGHQEYTKFRGFLHISGKKWLSIEPIWGIMNFPSEHLKQMEGVIIGHDNRKSAPGTDTLDPVRRAVDQCQKVGVPVFIKQLWIGDKLEKEPENFPEDLRFRDLPWSMPEVAK